MKENRWPVDLFDFLSAKTEMANPLASRFVLFGTVYYKLRPSFCKDFLPIRP